MIRMKKILLPFLFTIAIVCGVFVFTGFANNSIALAATVYFSDDKYTESDNLLNNDGSESYFTIQEFALDVKAASPGTSFPELAQVIPRQYLKTSTTNDEFYYNGNSVIASRTYLKVSDGADGMALQYLAVSGSAIENAYAINIT